MYNPMSAIIREATRDKNAPLNILTFVAHERYEPNLCKTGHNFYSLITEGTRYWHTEYSPIPPNYTIFRDGVPRFILDNIDLIISHNPFVHIPLAYNLHTPLPIINIFHTMPPPGWDSNNIRKEYMDLFNLCTKHIFISEFNKIAWGVEGEVIHHGINTELFNINSDVKKEPRILTVANDYINRNWALGFNIWNSIHKDLPMFPIGDTKGLSKPASNLEDMISIFQKSLIFLNTSLASPIPMSLLEAMSCGCACVSAATCMIPKIIEDGVDGFLCPAHKPLLFKERCKYLLDNPAKAIEMGQKARQKIISMFNLEKFVNNFNNVFRSIL